MENAKKKTKKQFQLLDDNTGNLIGGKITYIIAFVIPLVLFIALYYVKNIFPFGNNCYLRSDMYHQYAPFFSEMWNKIRNGESLTYSWNIGMGSNFTSLYAYYLASPANWFIALFPQKYMIEIMNSIIILKLAGASLSITYYLSKHFHNESCYNAIFGIFYCMSGYVAAYSWNIMWLDCIILVPLIMLGLEYLVNKNHVFLYCISLGLCIFTNYYIAIMVCISVVLYFIVLMVSFDGPKKFIIYVKKILNFGIFSLLSGGLAACLLLPEFYTFSLSASSDVTFPKKLSLYFSMLQMLTRQLINVPVHLGLEHYPNIYCGVAIFILIPLYVIDKKVDLREKIGKLIILLIFLTAFNLNIPNFIWHGFHFPNSLPCRQSFIYIFFVLTMSYEALRHIKASSNRHLGFSIFVAFAFLLVVEQIFAVDGTYDFKIVYLSGLFIIIYSILMFIHLNTNWKVPVVLFLTLLVTLTECTLNMEETGIGTTSRSAYLLDYDAVKTVTNTVKNDDDSFYRMDKVTGARSKNDGAWHNYHTISTFSSTSSAGISDLFGLLGFEHSTNAYGFNGATKVTESLFSIKYIISNKILAEDPLMTYYTGNNGEFVYKNNYSLPLGFMTSASINNEWKAYDTFNGIENQNSLIETLTGVSNVFTLTYNYKKETTVDIVPVKSGHMYLYVKNPTSDSIGVSINGTASNYSGLKNSNHIVDIGYVTPTDTIQAYSDEMMELYVYTLETDRFIEAYNKLSEGGLNITSHTDTKITGTVNAKEDGTMVFSIPYDGGWSVYIDGKKVSTYSIKNALLAVDVSKGEHTIKLKFTPVNLIPGCLLTALCIIILIAIWLIRKRIAKGLISIEKLPVIFMELIDENDIIYDKSEENDILSEQTELQNVLEQLDDFDNILNDDDEDDDFDEN